MQKPCPNFPTGWAASRESHFSAIWRLCHISVTLSSILCLFGYIKAIIPAHGESIFNVALQPCFTQRRRELIPPPACGRGLGGGFSFWIAAPPLAPRNDDMNPIPPRHREGEAMAGAQRGWTGKALSPLRG